MRAHFAIRSRCRPERLSATTRTGIELGASNASRYLPRGGNSVRSSRKRRTRLSLGIYYLRPVDIKRRASSRALASSASSRRMLPRRKFVAGRSFVAIPKASCSNVREGVLTCDGGALLSPWENPTLMFHSWNDDDPTTVSASCSSPLHVYI